MISLYESVVRPLLFRLDPERAHEYGRNLLKTVGFAPGIGVVGRFCNRVGGVKPVEVFGLRFPNRIGMAAGMDKDAEFVMASALCGFGHVEVGTVTPEKQPGNPQPRLFRYPAHEALVNRMGFNSQGVAVTRRRLARLPAKGRRPLVVGVNIGKNKNTPNESAENDYRRVFVELADYADYFTVNVSSPNTPGLRELQGRDGLVRILRCLQEANGARPGGRVPILLKIAPDLDFHQLDEIVAVTEETGIDGLVATNTTIARSGDLAGVSEMGGLSGRPLRARSTQVIRYLSGVSGGRIPIIGVGGIHDGASAAEKLDAGATLLQVYTGWVYRGPFFPRRLARAVRFHGHYWGGALAPS